MGAVVEGQQIGGIVLVGIAGPDFQRDPAVLLLLRKVVGAPQDLALEGIEHGGELRQRHRIGLGVPKFHRTHAHGEIPFAQGMVQQDEGHVPGLLLQLRRHGLGERQRQPDDAARVIVGHQHIVTGQLEILQAHGEVAAGGAAAERLHGIARQRRGLAHHGLRRLKVFDVAVGRDHQAGAVLAGRAFQLQRQAGGMALQQRVSTLDKGPPVQRGQGRQLAGKIIPEGGHLRGAQGCGRVVVFGQFCMHTENPGKGRAHPARRARGRWHMDRL